MHREFEFTVHLGAVAIDSDGKKDVIHKFERNAEVDYIYLATDTACNKANTNYNTFNFKNSTDSTTLASIANGPDSAAGTSFTAGVPVVCSTMTGGAVHSGDVLTFEPTKSGNGLALAGASVTVYGHYTD